MKPLSTASGKQVFRRIVFVAYLATVLGATLAPLSGDAYASVSGLDKLVHVALFGGVAVLLCWNLRSSNTHTALTVFVTTTTFAALIELVQGRLWYRSGDIWDLLAGAVGALIGIGFSWVVEAVLVRVKGKPG